MTFHGLNISLGEAFSSKSSLTVCIDEQRREYNDDDDDSASVASSTSLPLDTPKDPHPHTPSTTQVILDTAFTIENSLTETSASHPTFSSMEVELSGSTSIGADPACETSVTTEAKLSHIPQLHVISEPETPQRPATDIFGFLTERKKSIRQQRERDSLAPFPTPTISDMSSHLRTPNSNLSATTSYMNDSSPATTISDPSPAQIRTATITKLTPVMNPLSRSTNSVNLLQSYTPTSGYPKYPLSSIPHDTNTERQATLNLPTGSGIPRRSTGSSSSSRLSKIPKGPRPTPNPHETETSHHPRSTTPSGLSSNLNLPLPSENTQKPSRIPKVSNGPRSSTLDPFSLPQTSRRRTASRGTIASLIFADADENRRSETPAAKRGSSRKPVPVPDKENSPVFTDPPHTIPVQKTPRTHARAIFDARHPTFVNGDAPSPASSTELSPYAKDMMTSLRQQKQSTKESRRRKALALAGW